MLGPSASAAKTAATRGTRWSSTSRVVRPSRTRSARLGAESGRSYPAALGAVDYLAVRRTFGRVDRVHLAWLSPAMWQILTQTRVSRHRSACSAEHLERPRRFDRLAGRTAIRHDDDVAALGGVFAYFSATSFGLAAP